VYVYKLLLIEFLEDMLGTLWTIILIIVAIIVIVLLLQFLVGIFAIAPVGLEFVKSGTTANIALPIGTAS
jgi:hypothetical protein